MRNVSGPLQSWYHLCGLEIEDGHHCSTKFYLDNNEATFTQNTFSSGASYRNVIVNCLNHHFGMLIQACTKKIPGF